MRHARADGDFDAQGELAAALQQVRAGTATLSDGVKSS